MFNLNIIALKNAYKNNDTTAKELIFSLRQQALEQAEYNAWITLLEETKLTEYLSYLEGKTIDELPLYGF